MRPTVNAVNLSVYLCFLFLFALVVESAVTFAPGAQTLQRMLMGTWEALAVVFAVAIPVFRWLGVSRARWLVRSLLCIAILSTAAVLLLAVG